MKKIGWEESEKKRESREGRRKEREGKEEGLDPRLFLPSEPHYPGTARPPSSSLFREHGPWDCPGKSCLLEEPTKRTGHRMPEEPCNRLGLSPKVEIKLNAKVRFPKGWD